MTQPKTFTFGDFQLQIGDGASPEVFSPPCGFTERSIEIKSTAGETNIPDCDNEDAPVWTARDDNTKSATISGQGFTTAGAAPMWRTWALAGGKKNVRMGPINKPLASDGGYYAGVFVMSDWKGDVTKGTRATINVTLNSDGPLTWVPALT